MSFPPPALSSGSILWLRSTAHRRYRGWKWFLDTSCICVVLMYCVALTISLKSLNAVYFSTVTNIYRHAAHALFCPGWCSLQHIQFNYKNIVVLFCLINSKGKNHLECDHTPWFSGKYLVTIIGIEWNFKLFSDYYKFSCKMSISSWFYFAFNQKKKERF